VALAVTHASAAFKALPAKPIKMPLLKVATLQNKWRSMLVKAKRLSEPVPLDELDVDMVTELCVSELQSQLAQGGEALLPPVRLGLCALIAGDRALLRAALVSPTLRFVAERRSQLLEVRRAGVARRRIADELAIDDDVDNLPPQLVAAAHLDKKSIHGVVVRHTPESLALTSLRCDLQHIMTYDILYDAKNVVAVRHLVERALVRSGEFARDDDESGIMLDNFVADATDSSPTPNDVEEQISALCAVTLDDDSTSPLALGAHASLSRGSDDGDDHDHDCDYEFALCDLLHSPIDDERGPLASLTMHPLAVVTRIAVQASFHAITRAAVQVRSGLVCSEQQWLQEARKLDLGDPSMLERTKFAHLSKQSLYYIAGVAVRKAAKSALQLRLRANESLDERVTTVTHLIAHVEADESDRSDYKYGKKTRAFNKVQWCCVCFPLSLARVTLSPELIVPL
jgi:hypothetical protein